MYVRLWSLPTRKNEYADLFCPVTHTPYDGKSVIDTFIIRDTYSSAGSLRPCPRSFPVSDLEFILVSPLVWMWERVLTRNVRNDKMTSQNHRKFVKNGNIHVENWLMIQKNIRHSIRNEWKLLGNLVWELCNTVIWRTICSCSDKIAHGVQKV